MTDELADSLLEALAQPPSDADVPDDHEWTGEAPSIRAAAFAITDDRLATWALRRYAEAEREAARIDALAAEQRAIVDEWRANARKKPEATMSFMRAKLIAYLRNLQLAEGSDPDLDPKTKRITTPAGVVTARKSTSVAVSDEASLLEWLQDPTNKAYADAWVKTKTEVGVAPLKATLNLDAAPGIVVTKDGVPVPHVAINRSMNYSIVPAELPE